MAVFVSGDRHGYGAGMSSDCHVWCLLASCQVTGTAMEPAWALTADCHVWCLLASSYPAVRPLGTDLDPLNGFLKFGMADSGPTESSTAGCRERFREKNTLLYKNGNLLLW